MVRKLEASSIFSYVDGNEVTTATTTSTSFKKFRVRVLVPKSCVRLKLNKSVSIYWTSSVCVL